MEAANEQVWTETEYAAVSELIGLGTAYAAPCLHALFDGGITLDCAADAACSRRDAAHMLQENLKKPVIAVSRGFTGSYSGDLTILLPERARIAVAGTAIFSDGETDLETEAITKFADILLGECLAGFESMLGLGLTPGEIRSDQGFPYDVLLSRDARHDDQVFMFSLSLDLRDRRVPTTLIATVDAASTEALKLFIQAFLETDGGSERAH